MPVLRLPCALEHTGKERTCLGGGSLQRSNRDRVAPAVELEISVRSHGQLDTDIDG